ncbi:MULTISPECIES: DUF167 domain-containing protein [unclassified Thioalkalivibrio]|uniref:DUF167 domain-containing protein n=1 Tax=unclassified Thioalkalivibrio TaxID=2621013 RepID=UPI00035FD446|nr:MULTISPECIES: DUF167 domain-containing protein [unclassified Thioalkalivibrio]
MARLKVKVAPGSKRNAIAGWMGDTLKLQVQAPPEKGRANEAVIALLASELGCPKSAIRVVAGATSRSKTVLVEGWDEPDLRTALS